MKTSARPPKLTDRPPLFLLGLLVSTSLVLCAFEWRTPTKEGGSVQPLPEDLLLLEEELIAPVFTERRATQPPRTPQAIVDEFEYVEHPEASKNDFEAFYEPEPIPIDPLPEEVNEEPVTFMADRMPEFPGGDSLLYRYLGREISYPPSARKAGLQGTVLVSFLVAKDGSIGEVKIERGVSPDLDEEILRVMKEMPPWVPGLKNGEPVAVRFRMPVFFRLKH